MIERTQILGGVDGFQQTHGHLASLAGPNPCAAAGAAVVVDRHGLSLVELDPSGQPRTGFRQRTAPARHPARRPDRLSSAGHGDQAAGPSPATTAGEAAAAVTPGGPGSTAAVTPGGPGSTAGRTAG